MMDLHSIGGIAQADIRKFYDSIDLNLVCEWLLDNGCDCDLVGSIARLAVCPRVRLRVCDNMFEVGERHIGVYTGSRLAGALGRIPILDAFDKCKRDVTKALFVVGDHRVPVMCWIDNVYVVAASGQKAVDSIEQLGEQLRSTWRLDWKDGSKSLMLPKHSYESESVELPAGWLTVECLSVLGHQISNSGSIEDDFESAVRAAWRAFFANPASSLGKAGGQKRQWKLFQQTVVPAIAYRWSKWPPQRALMNKIDGVQANMLGALLNLPKNPLEGIDSYMCRRGRAARAIARKQGAWSSLWVERAKAWCHHLQRHVDSPAGMVMAWHNRDWLQKQRAEQLTRRKPKAGHLTILASWTATRKKSGQPSIRFEDGRAAF